jgi:hypothetical protein
MKKKAIKGGSANHAYIVEGTFLLHIFPIPKSSNEKTSMCKAKGIVRLKR